MLNIWFTYIIAICQRKDTSDSDPHLRHILFSVYLDEPKRHIQPYNQTLLPV